MTSHIHKVQLPRRYYVNNNNAALGIGNIIITSQHLSTKQRQLRCLLTNNNLHRLPNFPAHGSIASTTMTQSPGLKSSSSLSKTTKFTLSSPPEETAEDKDSGSEAEVPKRESTQAKGKKKAPSRGGKTNEGSQSSDIYEDDSEDFFTPTQTSNSRIDMTQSPGLNHHHTYYLLTNQRHLRCLLTMNQTCNEWKVCSYSLTYDPTLETLLKTSTLGV